MGVRSIKERYRTLERIECPSVRDIFEITETAYQLSVFQMFSTVEAARFSLSPKEHRRLIRSLYQQVAKERAFTLDRKGQKSVEQCREALADMLKNLPAADENYTKAIEKWLYDFRNVWTAYRGNFLNAAKKEKED